MIKEIKYINKLRVSLLSQISYLLAYKLILVIHNCLIRISK